MRPINMIYTNRIVVILSVYIQKVVYVVVLILSVYIQKVVYVIVLGVSVLLKLTIATSPNGGRKTG